MAAKKDKYTIIMDSSDVGTVRACQLVVQQVNLKIAEGYVPHGNLVVTADNEGSPKFFQAMVFKGAPAPPTNKG